MFWTILIIISTGLSTVALVAAGVALVNSRRLIAYQSWPYERIDAMNARVDEIDVLLTQHHERIRRMNARLAARDRRQRDRTQPGDGPDFVGDNEPELPLRHENSFARLPGESDVDWKARMRVQIATGGLKHG